jgi:hypothetical protein
LCDYVSQLAKAKAMHFVQEYKEYHTETKVEFVITIPTNVLAQMEREGTVEQRLHLTTTIPRVPIITFFSFISFSLSLSVCVCVYVLCVKYARVVLKYRRATCTSSIQTSTSRSTSHPRRF